jgi:hypothetical protein
LTSGEHAVETRKNRVSSWIFIKGKKKGIASNCEVLARSASSPLLVVVQ